MRARVVVLSGGLAAVLVGLFAVVGQLLPRAEPEAAVRFNDPRPVQVTPSRKPRREPDVDRGTPVSNGVFVDVPDGWKRVSMGGFTLGLVSWGRGAAFVLTGSTHPVTSVPLLRPDAEGFAQTMQLYGVQVDRVRTLPVPNRNVVEVVAISFTGLRKMDGLTYSLSGECVRLRGAPDTNDISLSLCWSAYVQDLGTVRPEVQRMIASVALSV